MDNVTRRVLAAGAALAVLGLATGAAAQQPVKIGVIYPLSGNSASAAPPAKTRRVTLSICNLPVACFLGQNTGTPEDDQQTR